MKKLFFSLALALVSTVAVYAQNPHFVAGPTVTDNGTTLTVTGSIAGLGNNQLITIELNVSGTVTTECTNRGGNVAPGQTKTDNFVVVGNYTSDRNGRVNFSVTTPSPTPGRCPNGNWTGTVTDVSFGTPVVKVNGVPVQ
ncbi:MAG: hypothetical protein RL213_909 [Bacteroidota bacterium]|jgi:hypothetical protein